MYCSLGLVTACGTEASLNQRQQTLSALDAKASTQVYLSFQLPDRQKMILESPDKTALINSYYFRFVGEGPNCPIASEVHEEWGSYEDRKLVGAKVSTACNYRILIKLGQAASEIQTALSAPTATYNDTIQALVNTSCVSCHSSFKEASTVRAQGAAIVSVVENGTMPPQKSLSDDAIASFLAWRDGGYLEADPRPSVLTASEQKLSKVYYRNNNDDILQYYELYGVTTKDLRRSLWLQEEGLQDSLQTRQLYTFGGNPEH